MATRNTRRTGKCSLAVHQEVREMTWRSAQGLCLQEALCTLVRRVVTSPLPPSSGSQTSLQGLGYGHSMIKIHSGWTEHGCWMWEDKARAEIQ